MPQEMNVLCCYSCKMYQVHIVKKARKWQCKLCNAKQSVQQIYLQGSGQDCRLYVQQLNSLKANDVFSVIAAQSDIGDNSSASVSIYHETCADKTAESKWAKYLDSSEKENLFNAQNCARRETEAVLSRESSPCDDVTNDARNFENLLDDSNFETENDEVIESDEGKNLQSTKSNSDGNSDDKHNLQVKSKFNEDVTSIFESNEELDEPIEF